MSALITVVFGASLKTPVPRLSRSVRSWLGLSHYLIEMSAEEHDGNAGGSLHPTPDHCPPPPTHGRLTVR